MRVFRRPSSLMVFAFVALALAACSRPSTGSGSTASGSTESGETTREAAPRTSVTPVRAVTVKSDNLRASRAVTVTLEAGTDSQIASGASGRVIEVVQREGARVQAGAVVVRLDDRDLRIAARNAQLALETARINLSRSQRSSQETQRQAKARFEAAQTNLSVVQSRFDANTKLFAAGGISQVEYRNSKAQLEQAQADTDTAKDNLARAGRATNEDLALLKVQVSQAENQVAQTQKNLNETAIRAPFSGEIADVLVEVGEFVQTGGRVFRLANVSTLRATFSVPPEDAALLPPGSSVIIAYNGRNYPAKIVRSAQVPGQNRLVQLTARLNAPNTDENGNSSNRVPVGAVAELRYSLKLAAGSLVPTGALQTEGGLNYVYAIENNKAVRRDVRVLGESGGTMAVTGVAGGARVVFPVPPSLQDGNQVTVVGGEQR